MYSRLGTIVCQLENMIILIKDIYRANISQKLFNEVLKITKIRQIEK